MDKIKFTLGKCSSLVFLQPKIYVYIFQIDDIAWNQYGVTNSSLYFLSYHIKSDQIIHESEIVCRYLNSRSNKHRLDLDISIAKDIRIQIHG
jgi:hypothetical protein